MQPTLLRDYQGQDVSGWLMSEKLDGWRALWDGKSFWTRQGRRLDAPEWFTLGMPDHALDGEIYAGRGRFNFIRGLIRDGWFGLAFEAFDAPELGGTFRQRAKVLAGIKPTAALRIVRHICCKGTPHMIETANEVVAMGGEGVVVRNPRARYTPGRTDDVLRWVPQCPTLNRL